jgi:hypothetical protein
MLFCCGVRTTTWDSGVGVWVGTAVAAGGVLLGIAPEMESEVGELSSGSAWITGEQEISNRRARMEIRKRDIVIR